VVGPNLLKGVELLGAQADVLIAQLLDQDVIERRRGRLVILSPLRGTYRPLPLHRTALAGLEAVPYAHVAAGL